MSVLMADNSEQFDKDRSPEFPDGAIRRFLLGRLSAGKRLPFEARLFADDSLEARVRLAEYELADDYVFERLGLAERKLFEQKFLLSIDRQEKLMVSRALRDRFASVSAAVPFEGKTTVGDRLRVLLGFTQPARRFAFGVVIMLLVIGTFWLVVKEPRITGRFIARRPSVVRPTPFTTPKAAHAVGGSSTPTHDETSSPLPPHEPPIPKINSSAKTESMPAVSIILFPATSRESGNTLRINLPKGEHDIVRLELSLKWNRPGTYRAELLTIDGQSVFSDESLNVANTDGSKAYLDVAAGLLKTGDYQIKLIRVSDGSAASYYFRAQ
jgi:hypothetical protein